MVKVPGGEVAATTPGKGFPLIPSFSSQGLMMFHCFSCLGLCLSCLGLWFDGVSLLLSGKSSLKDLSSMKVEFFTLNLA